VVSGRDGAVLRELAMHSFSSCSWDHETSGKASNWKNLVLWLPSVLELAKGDTLTVVWTVNHSGAASTYRAQLTHTHTPCSSSSLQQPPPQPPVVVVVEQWLDAGELYPKYAKAMPADVRRSETLSALGVFD